MNKIPFYRHDLGKPELDEIARVLKGTILTTGEFVSEFENKFAGYLGCRNVVACMSCTGAMHIALTGLGVGPGDEVITTPMTFIATSAAIIQAGAKPIFVDVEPDTGNIDVSCIEAAITARTKAIIPVHLYGQMCDMRAMRKMADRHGLVIVEDSAHCVEGERDGVKPGQLSEAACFSFFATKNLACGEGGAVAVNDDTLAAKLRLLRTHGMTKTSSDREKEGYQHWDMVCMGWKYNMDNIHAAILLPQMKMIGEKWSRRQHLVDRYISGLSGIRGLSWPRRLPGRHANHLFTVWVDVLQRDDVISKLGKQGVPAVVNYRAIHQLTYFRDAFGLKRGDFPVAESIGDSTLTLPLFCSMTDEQVDEVCLALRESIV